MARNVPTLTTKPEALPAAVRELVRVLGDADAMRLIGAMSGAAISVPKHPKDDHPLRMALSPAGFASLIAEWGGGILEVPKGDAYLRRMRHDHVRQCRGQGLTVTETADVTGYSRRHVISIIGGMPGVDTKTLDMFGFDDEETAPVSHAGWANDPFGLAKAR